MTEEGFIATADDCMANNKKPNKMEEALEIRALRRIISAYLNYSDAAEEDVKRWERSYAKLLPQHKALITHIPKKYQQLRRCIDKNSIFILNMLQGFEPPFDMSQDEDAETSENYHHSHDVPQSAEKQPEVPKFYELQDIVDANAKGRQPNQGNCIAFDWRDPAFHLHVSPADVDKVRCILRNIVRDWAPEGAIERKQCYQPILEELQRHFPNPSKDRPPSCLVPGAGLARLALEISLLGFVSQGNEFSYYMMICSSFILNHTQAPMEWVIYPWIHSNCNSLCDEDQLRPVYFPDLHPGSAGITEGFSMCAGDFVEVYGDPSQSGRWDAVATCFFIDTAHNVVEYIEIISRILKDGGVWINLGPLLYHFADIYSPDDDMSIELSLEDVKRIAFHYGFELETERTIETTYTTNLRSMMQNRYFAVFWTMIKKGSSAQCVSAKEA